MLMRAPQGCCLCAQDEERRTEGVAAGRLAVCMLASPGYAICFNCWCCFVPQ